MKGVITGKNVEFFGIPAIIRLPESVISIGEGCSFRSHYLSNYVGINRRCMLTTMDDRAKLTIGNNCGISGAVISAAQEITIGNDVVVGANALITDFDWHSIDPEIRLRDKSVYESAPVRIGNNVWIGLNTVVLKGVSIGDNTVIGANSVVTKDISSNVVAAGMPCKVLRVIK